ncbi:two-component sensor histidine kinase, partial [Streptomyces sp. TRM76130]|nr:two-component sensor histidine kinase [Streptomyces sp. TRM76130]
MQGKLYDQLDEELKKATALTDPKQVGQIREALATCTQTPREGGFGTTYSQIVTADGTTCLFTNS